MTTSANTTGTDPVPARARRSRRILGWLALAVGITVVSVTFGVATAQADGTLGPHVAQYQVTLDHQVTVDFGPLGALVIDSPAPVLGMHVIVGEIPAELTSLDQSSTIDALSGDLQAYLRFFAAPQIAMDAAVHALVVDAAVRSAGAAAALVALGLTLGGLLGPTRRTQLAQAAGPHTTPLAAGVATVLVLGVTVTASDARDVAPEDQHTASVVFDGTPLEGARITGRLAGLIDTYGGYALDMFRQNEEFYADATDSVEAAWTRQLWLESFAPHPAPVPTIDVLVVSDLHCNIGMASVIGEVARLADVDIVLNAGDSTINGTAVESYCVQTFAAAVPDGVPYVIADGNHDSVLTAEQEAAAGAIVLSGEVVDVGGLRILGDSDPVQTRIGEGSRLAGDENAIQTGERLARTACEEGDVDLLLVHTPETGNAALARGCVPAQISGHWHMRTDPHQRGLGIRYVSASTAGATLGQPTIGPLQGTAELTVLRLDAQTRRFLDYRLVRVTPSGEAQVDMPVLWPQIEQPAQHDATFS